MFFLYTVCDIIILTSAKITQAIHLLLDTRKNGKLSFQPWDFDILIVYLFMNEFRIKFEFEYSVYSF